MGAGEGSPPRDSEFPPGFDEDDPYAGEDIATYPEWWRAAIVEFREHGMRPYRPPRFADGEPVPAVIDRLTAELGVDIDLRAIDPQTGGEWRVRVDGDPVASVRRERTGAGYTEYGIGSAEFEAVVREAVGE